MFVCVCVRLCVRACAEFARYQRSPKDLPVRSRPPKRIMDNLPTSKTPGLTVWKARGGGTHPMPRSASGQATLKLQHAQLPCEYFARKLVHHSRVPLSPDPIWLAKYTCPWSLTWYLSDSSESATSLNVVEESNPSRSPPYVKRTVSVEVETEPKAPYARGLRVERVSCTFSHAWVLRSNLHRSPAARWRVTPPLSA